MANWCLTVSPKWSVVADTNNSVSYNLELFRSQEPANTILQLNLSIGLAGWSAGDSSSDLNCWEWVVTTNYGDRGFWITPPLHTQTRQSVRRQSIMKLGNMESQLAWLEINMCCRYKRTHVTCGLWAAQCRYWVMTRDGRKCAISAGLVSGYGVVCVSFSWPDAVPR